MISNSKQKQQPQSPQQQQKQFNNCLFKFGKTKFISSLNNSTKTSLDSPKLFKSKMSSMTADLRSATAAGKAVKSTTMKPPMEAVVVNSIIYSKPSFCSIVVDLGCGGSIAGEVPLAKEKMAKLPNGCCPNKTFANEGFNPGTMGIKSSLTSFAAACLTGFTCPESAAATPPPPPPSSSLLAQTKDAQVYSLCTTINGSIHHQMSDLCDNLLAMAGFFNQAANHQHDNDDDSVIEFAYDDGDYEEDVIENEEDFDDDDDEEEETDDDIDCEYNHNLCDYGDDYEDDNDDDYLPADKDIVDFSYKCLTENAPILNCDKRKKVRFNTKPTVHVMHTWNYAYRAARKGQWEMYARDRERFRLRVQRASLILNPILEREHRQKIFEKRFLNNVDNFDDQTQLQQQQATVEVKSKVIQNAEQIDATTKEKKPESKNIYQKKKRKKRRRFCKMGNKHYF